MMLSIKTTCENQVISPSIEKRIQVDEVEDADMDDIEETAESADMADSEETLETQASIFLDDTIIDEVDMEPALDDSFNISDREVETMPEIVESFLPDRSMSDTTVEETDVQYEVVESGTKRGGKKLVSSDGFSYTVKRSSPSQTYWTCSIRNKTLRCAAVVVQPTYLHQTWFSSPIYTPASLTVCNHVVRTNNDVEGWHRRLNARANGSGLPFYVLVPLLRREADFVKLQMRLVQDNLYTRDNRRQYRRIQAKLEDLWTKYSDNQSTTSKFLLKASAVYGSF